jgi:hypothetical protein
VVTAATLAPAVPVAHRVAPVAQPEPTRSVVTVARPEAAPSVVMVALVWTVPLAPL